jgi:hypothetical protein
MREFCNGAAIQDFVRVQLVAGVMVVLVFVRIHHPRIDLSTVGKGLPHAPDGGGWSMVPHYDVVVVPANNITGIVEAESDMVCQLRDELTSLVSFHDLLVLRYKKFSVEVL